MTGILMVERGVHTQRNQLKIKLIKNDSFSLIWISEEL